MNSSGSTNGSAPCPDMNQVQPATTYSSPSSFSNASGFTVTGSEFNTIGRDQTNIRQLSYSGQDIIPTRRELDSRTVASASGGFNTSRNYDENEKLLSQLQSGIQPVSPLADVYGGEINYTSRDQIKVTVVNVIESREGQPANALNSNSAQEPYLGFPLFDIHEMEDDTPDLRPGSGRTVNSIATTATTSTTASSTSEFSRFRFRQQSQDQITMTSLQDSQSCLAVDTREEYTSICDLYIRLMLPKAQGYPLWSPGPSSSLPVEYRNEGICIGDVGLITSDGAFDFLFNIFLSANHPVNPGNLYEDFVPLHPLLDRDIDARLQFDSGSSLLNGRIHQHAGENDAYQMSFECAGAEGAVLLFPDGAFSTDARNKSIFREYAAQNAEKWYQYANGVRAREAENNTLYLVTGCVKSESWGIAAYDSISSRSGISLKHSSHNGRNGRRAYSWRTCGGASARTYPNSANDFLDVPGARNQCTFLRGYRIALQEEAWNNMFQIPALAVPGASGDGNNFDETKSSTNSNDATIQSKKGWFSKLFKQSRKYGSGDTTGKGSSSAGNSGALLKEINPPLTLAQTKSQHPSYSINQMLLKEIQCARVVMSHDDDWCSVLLQQENDTVDLNTSHILESLQESHIIFSHQEAAFLLSRSTEEFNRPAENAVYPKCANNTTTQLANFGGRTVRTKKNSIRELQSTVSVGFSEPVDASDSSQRTPREKILPHVKIRIATVRID